jgi:uroporphyrinogen-III synthase
MGIPWPAIGIDDQEPDPTALAAVASAEPSDLAIFVSRNAVARGAPLLNRKRLPRIAAIGPSTRRALEAAALPTSFDSEGYDTEALLAHPEMAELSGGRVFIFRGVGGRETLGEQLRVRGGRVRYIEVYRRRPRASAPAERAGLLRQWTDRKIHVYTATSVEILEALYADLAAGFSSLLAATPLVTASRRVVQRSKELRHQAERILAPGPDDRSLVEAIASWSGRLGDPAVRQE